MMIGSNTPLVERFVSSRLLDFLIMIVIGGIQNQRSRWLTLRDCLSSRSLRWAGTPTAKLRRGLTYLVNTSASGDIGWLYSIDVPIADRVGCVEAVASLF